MSKVMNEQFEIQARELCREHGFPETEANVKVLVEAMRFGAATLAAKTSSEMRDWTDKFVARRERANAPQ